MNYLSKVRLFLSVGLVTVLFAHYSNFVRAEEGQVELEPVVITANLFEQKLYQVSQSVEVISSKQIREMGAQVLSDVLRLSSSIEVNAVGSPGEELDIRMRGSDRDEVLVLLDGVALNGLIDSRAVILSSIPIDLVEKVEILKGPQSVIYGSSAVGGVINIITKKGSTEPVYGLKLDAGNLSTFKESIFTLATHGKHAYSFNFTRHDQGGRFNNDRFAANSFFSNYRFDASERFSFNIGLVYLNQKQELALVTATSFAAFPTVNLYFVFDDDRRLTRDLFIPQAIVHINPLDWYKIRLSYGMYFEKLSIDNTNQNETAPDPAAALDSQHYTSTAHRHQFDLRNIFNIIDNNRFNLTGIVGGNADLEFLKYTDAPFTGDTTAKTITTFPDSSTGQKGRRRNISGYAQLSAGMQDRLFLTGGIRIDDNDTYGRAFSPRISSSYTIPKIKLKAFGTYSRGFLAPSINQYYLAVAGGTLTQNLNKESSSSVEVGLNKLPFRISNLGELSLGSTYFYTDYDSHIDDLQLINDAHVWGVESFITYRPVKWLALDANYTYLRTENDDNGNRLVMRSKNTVNTLLKIMPLKNLSLDLSFHYKSNRLLPAILSTQTVGDLNLAFFDNAGNSLGTVLPAFYTFNMATVYQHHFNKITIKQINYSVRVNNILNKSYQERFGYPMPGFNFLFGIDVLL